MKINTPFKCVPLHSVVYFQEGPGLRNWQYGSSGIPFLNIRTFMDSGRINKELCQFVKAEEFQNKYEHFLLDAGDYVVSSSGTLGKLAEIFPEDLPVMLNTSVIRFRPLDCNNLDRIFLKWFIRSPLYIQQIKKASTGTAIQNYGPSHLKKMIIPLPPIAQQKRIAAILDKADAVRRKRREAIRLTEELLRSTFLEMFGDPITNPKGWDMVTLGDVLTDIESGWSPVCDNQAAENNQWGVLKLGAITQGYFKPEENKAILPNTKPRTDLEIKDGDLLFSRKNTYELVGACAYVDSCPSRLMMPDLMFRLQVIEEIEKIFLWQALSQKSTRDMLSKLASGSSGSMPNISKARLKTLKVIKPDKKNQQKYSRFYENLKLQKMKQEFLISESENLFNSLLQRAFTGDL